MSRWFCALVTGGVLSGFALLLITGEYANDGPVVLPLTQNHGLHAGDVFVVGGWVVAILALGWLTSGLRTTAACRLHRTPPSSRLTPESEMSGGGPSRKAGCGTGTVARTGERPRSRRYRLRFDGAEGLQRPLDAEVTGARG